MKFARFDIHQHITDKIVNVIERAAGDFRLPWHRAAGNILRPINIASKKAYRGINVVALWAYAEEFDYSSGIWGAYRQWAEAGAQVRKGEKAAFVVFYKQLEFTADPETGDTETATRLFARATPVFAAEQVDGYQALTSDASPATVITPIEQAEAFVAASTKHPPKEPLPPKSKSTPRHNNKPGLRSHFLLTRLVHYHAAIRHILTESPRPTCFTSHAAKLFPLAISGTGYGLSYATVISGLAQNPRLRAGNIRPFSRATGRCETP